MEVELGTIIEFIVLGAIAIELFALYNHSKLDHRIDEHILDTDRNLEKYDVMIQVLSNNMKNLDEHLIRLDEHMNKLDEHMNKLDEHMNRYDEHMNRYDEHMNRYDEHMNKLDEHINRYDRRLDEHMIRLDDIVWKSYMQMTDNRDDSQPSKDEQTSQ